MAGPAHRLLAEACEPGIKRIIVLRLLSGCSSGWPEPRVPGVGSPFSQARLTAGVGSRPPAAGLERLEFQTVGSGKQPLGTGQATGRQNMGYPI